ncbi:MAG: hypothetical protein N3D84_02735 [Candidatus Woesearchaeota archaeon]|nr:hypothetical protein [Candidatus Woesearchaeota archaeon]
MEFKVEKRPKMNIERYSKEEFDIAFKFAEMAYKEFGSFIKSIAIFGSTAKKEKKIPEEGDIDILIIVDDLSINITPAVAEAYRLIVEKLIRDISLRLHVTTLKLTSFWEFIRIGDPVAINILRDGLSLLDTGFFEPLQLLLKQGRVRPTAESVWNYYIRAPATMLNSKWHILQATLDLYWAVIDAAHAALMKNGEVPPSPEHVADLIEDKLVSKGKTIKKYADTMRKFYELSKKIAHREIKEISGEDYQKYYKEADDFVKEMKRLVEER